MVEFNPFQIQTTQKYQHFQLIVLRKNSNVAAPGVLLFMLYLGWNSVLNSYYDFEAFTVMASLSIANSNSSLNQMIITIELIMSGTYYISVRLRGPCLLLVKLI